MPNIKVVDMAGKEVSEITLSDKVFGASVNAAVLHTAVRAYLMNQRQGTQSTLTRTEVSGGGRKPWKQKGTGHARQGSTRAPQWTHGGVALGPKPRSYRMELNKQTKRTALFSALSAKVADGDMIVVDSIAATEYKTKPMVSMIEALVKAEATKVTKTVKSYKHSIEVVEIEAAIAEATEANDTAKLAVLNEKLDALKGTKAYYAPAEQTEVTKVDDKKVLIVLPEVNSFVIKSCGNIEGVKTTQWNSLNVYDILNSDVVIVAKDAIAKIEEVYVK